MSRTGLRVEARAETLPMNDLTVFVNNIPVTPGRGRPLQGAEAKQVARELVVDLPSAENTVRVEISNGRAIGVGELVVDAAGPVGKRAATAGDLYVLAVGINKFPLLKRPDGGSVDTNSRRADADELARLLGAGGGGHFKAVYARSLTDESDERPTRDRIVRAMELPFGGRRARIPSCCSSLRTVSAIRAATITSCPAMAALKTGWRPRPAVAARPRLSHGRSSSTRCARQPVADPDGRRLPRAGRRRQARSPLARQALGELTLLARGCREGGTSSRRSTHGAATDSSPMPFWRRSAATPTQTATG